METRSVSVLAVAMTVFYKDLAFFVKKIAGEYMYTNEEKAIHFVFKAFQDQKRIKEDINAGFHSVCVGYMLKALGCEEDIVITGFLHDIIEDTDSDYNDIASNFGKTIADNVLKVSENMNIADWKSRKIEFFERLKNYDNDIIVVELADKLHNLLSDYPQFTLNGKEALATLNTTYDMNKWYYLGMQEIFNKKLDQNELLIRYNKIIEEYFE